MSPKFPLQLLISLLLVITSCASLTAGDSNELVIVKRIIDGDTIEVIDVDGNEDKVRLIGIDTPERGKCGFIQAGERLSALILNDEVELISGGTDDRDRYGRLLRYVDIGETDTGLLLIQEGFAIAKYDSRQVGYPKHNRESAYISADSTSSNICK
jgi:micrococcal nuclease